MRERKEISKNSDYIFLERKGSSSCQNSGGRKEQKVEKKFPLRTYGKFELVNNKDSEEESKKFVKVQQQVAMVAKTNKK